MSPAQDKNETSRFLGEGVSFKAKLIGILEVSEARGDRMCQEALADLKMAIRAAGEHKQRITINIAIDGLRLRDEKTGDSLYHHPVHKISFIAQDMSDSRAFGYIFGSPDTGHRFFGIKTDKAASQVVIAMRDLFQVVFALKKKEIELAKQHLDKTRYTNTSLFSDSSQPVSKVQTISQDSEKSASESKSANLEESKTGGTAVADLVDLELELNHLQQGLTQMERITPSDPFGSKDDPFGDSFISYPKPFLPPPPPSTGRDRTRVTSETRSTESFESGEVSFFKEGKTFDFPQDFVISEDRGKGDWFTTPPQGGVAMREEQQAKMTVDQHEIKKQEILSQFDVFTELDPLGTGKIKPYVDKKHFFQDLKNPPKKVLNDLLPQTQDPITSLDPKPPTIPVNPKPGTFDSDPFGDDPFKEDPFAETDFLKQDPFNTDNCDLKLLTADSNLGLFQSPAFKFNFETQKTSRENVGLDLGEEAPAPPPRPAATGTVQIEPPPLPPKKVRPPPRPPHHEEGSEAVTETVKNEEVGPPLPLPQRRPKTDWSTKKDTSDEDYLTPISEPKDGFSEDLDGLDITLSQLTLSGLNELATKLNIPASQLSNMTLVQLTSYLSNFIKNKSKVEEKAEDDHQTFKADFAANCGSTTEQYDRYAAFRELFKEAPQVPVKEEVAEREDEEGKGEDVEVVSKEDRYAALREIVEMELENEKSGDAELESIKNEVLIQNETNLFKTAKEVDDDKPKTEEIIKYKTPPSKSPEPPTIKSPAVTEILQKPTSGSLSDVISGSSPEIDNTGSTSEIAKKNPETTAESWAIFDQTQEENNNNNKPHTVQSEEGVSPWSSDSKEFGNVSPPPRQERRGRQESGRCRRRMREQETWWDTSAEPEASYYPGNRHSTDSYEEECFNYYDRACHRRQIGWQLESGGGHSSSSRDVSPLDEEHSRRDHSWRRHQESFGRRRRPTDSWDEEDDDFEYEEEPRIHYGRREMDRESEYRRRREKCCCPDRDLEPRYASARLRHESKSPERDMEPRYASARMRHDSKKKEEYYYSRDSQESLYDDEYSNDDPYLHYATAKRNWKRPSSASEMERKTRQPYLTASDGERDRKYKGGRRSRSRDSQYTETMYTRHKPEPAPPLRRQKPKTFDEGLPPKPIEMKKEALSGPRKLAKPRQESLPRKRATFESDFAPSETESPVFRQGKRFTFEELAAKPEQKTPQKQKSLFEDDFIPSHETSISSIKEEGTDEDSIGKLEKRQKRTFVKGRLADVNLKKSESVNIFARENDPFDDDFFSEGGSDFNSLEFDGKASGSTKGGERKWSENFEDFGDDERI